MTTATLELIAADYARWSQQLAPAPGDAPPSPRRQALLRHVETVLIELRLELDRRRRAEAERPLFSEVRP